MLGTVRHGHMDPALLKPRPNLLEESSGSGAEGRPRKRIQRTTSENEDPLRRTGPQTTIRAPVAGQVDKSSPTKRRSTLRETSKPVLLGPRPLETGKRVISDSQYQQGMSAYARPNHSTTSSASSSTEQILGQSFSNSNTRLSMSQQRFHDPNDRNSSSEFLPPLNFDDLHTSITGISSVGTETNRFPTLTSSSNSGNAISITSQQVSTQPNGPVPDREQNGKVSRSASLVRRFSNARRQPSQSSVASNQSSMPPPPNPNRGRRQSTLSSVTPTSNAGSRQPRKSIGPGYTPTGFRSQSQSREPRVQPSQSQPSLARSGSINRANRPGSMLPNPNGDNLNASRFAKTKSLQPPPRGQNSNFLVPQGLETPGASPRPRNRANTPSSGKDNRRLSTVYVGGLGARTISPTDARRLKRLSSVPKPPQPTMPSLSQPELTPTGRRSSHSPAAFPRKSSTPSSSRTTPDFIKKNVAAVSSPNPNFTNLRVNPNAGPRTSQILTGSRLPTAKPRVQSSTGFVEEEVPPVPAIPKAYESPKDQYQMDPSSYFPRKPDSEGRKSSTSNSRPNTAKLVSLAAPTVQLPAPVEAPKDPKQANRHRRAMTAGNGSESDRGPTAAPNLSKKNLQPLRLPPLNLLPLGTPTTSRIASFPAPSVEVDTRQQETPPPKRSTKTPSTPMTASKATFFARSNDDDGWPAFQDFRSSSSHHPIRPGQDGTESKFDLGMAAGPPIPIPAAGSHRNHAASPFSSNSLPKLTDVKMGGMDGQSNGLNFSQSYGAGEMDFHMVASEQQSPKVVSQQHTQSATSLGGAVIGTPHANPSARTSSSDEPGTPASSTSLRRKLSLTWKRSSSKASARIKEALAAEKEENKRQNEMPPPKMPASATWTSRNSSDAGSGRPSLDSRPRKSSNSLSQGSLSLDGETDSNKESHGSSTNHPHHHHHQQQPQQQVETPQQNQTPSQKKSVPRSSSTSILTPMQRMLGGKGSLNALRHRQHGEAQAYGNSMDKEDAAADRIMEKLSSKRKDFADAAREVDDLRRRAIPAKGYSPREAIYSVNLNIFERGEIVDYKEVFFTGTKSAKKIVGDLDQSSTNFGYDDERGDYNIVLGDHLAYRYEVIDVLGKGSFGQVVRCIDHKLGVLVAVKIIRNKKRFHQQALVEVNILQKLREWDPDNKHSMINFTQHFYFRGHLCISTELLGINLYEFIKAYEFKGFPLALIRRFTKQILSSLILLKSKRVIHCDLKPENILLAHPMHSEIKVIDFGSSCFENEKVYTYIQSRFYRSPEVILGMSYGIPIDMWSLGCILAELYSGYPIFPGENEQEQLACIMEIFGPPEKHLIEKSSRKKLFFDSMGKPRVTVSSKGKRRRPSSKTLQQAIKCDDEAFLDFLAQCLRWDPERRLKPDQALGHEFITGQKMPRGSTSSMAGSSTGMNSARPTRIMSSSMVPGQGLTAAGAVGGASPGKRYTSNPHLMGSGNHHHQNTTGSTPVRSGRDRDVSGGVRPLPEPPSLGVGFRGPNTASASPIKGYGSTRRVSAAPGSGALSQQQVNGGPVKRMATTGGASSSRQQQNQTPQGQQATAGSSRSRNNQNVGLGVGMGISMDGGGLAGTAAAAAAGMGRTR